MYAKEYKNKIKQKIIKGTRPVYITIFCPSTLPYMTFSALSEEELGPISLFHQARTANPPARFPFPVGTLK